jgi:hypothetical protein
MGTSPDSQFELTAEHIPTRVKCRSIIEHAESKDKRLLAFVQMFATGQIPQSAGIVIVKARHHPPMQPLHNGSYCCMPRFGVGITFFVPISITSRALHLLPQMQQPDSSQWYLSNTIDLNASNLFYM